MKYAHLINRFANVTLCVVLLVLAGFSICFARLNQQGILAVKDSELYRQINYALSTEESAQYEYVLNPTPALEQEHLADATTLIALFQRLQQSGTPDDAVFARQLLAQETHYLLLSGQFYAAVNAHDLTRARMLHYQAIDPVFDSIQQAIQRKSNQEEAQATENLTQLAQVQQIAFTIIPLMLVFGLLLMTVSWWITRGYRRKIVEAAQAEITRLEQFSLTDPLTGLGNYHAYQERLSQALEAARRQDDMLVLALLDIDEFTMFNEEQGHQQGDDVLRALATMLREARLSDALFHLSSDDFTVIISQTTLADATLAFERFREDVERSKLGITVSMGIAHAASDNLTRELLLVQGAVALQEAKRRGRNRVLTFAAIEGEVSIISSVKIQALRRVLSEGKMKIVFQPIWNLATGTVLAFEALARPDADYGFAGPQEMFDIAEAIGRAHELDVVCVQAILMRAAELPPDTLLFLNLTPQTLVHNVLTGATLLEAVVSSGLSPSRVVLEITERSIVQLDEVVQKVKFLRLMGFRVALDDAGAGNAGLEMLSQLSVDFVKIDRSVVSRSLTDQMAHSVLSGIVSIARELGISVVAEGIENLEMLDLVRQLEVQCAQGYLLGRPSETIPEASTLQDLSPFLYSGSR